MLENGFIKLHRKILKWEWYGEPNTMRLFIHLLLTVNLQESVFQGAKIPRGGRVSSYNLLAKELNLTIKQIRTASQHLERTGEVARTAYPKFTVFTVTNYDSYQVRGTAKGTQKGKDAGNARASEGQQNKKIKESQEEKEESRAPAAPLAGSTPAPSGAGLPAAPAGSTPRASGAGLPAAGGKSIYERMRE